MVKFLLTPSEYPIKPETGTQDVTNCACITPLTVARKSDQKKSNRFVSTGKRFKTLCNRRDNTKRKLQFLRPKRSDSLENDSESLFVDSAKDAKIPDHNKRDGSPERRSFVADSSKNAEMCSKKSATKRKCEGPENGGPTQSECGAAVYKKSRTRSTSKKRKFGVVRDPVPDQSQIGVGSASTQRCKNFGKYSSSRMSKITKNEDSEDARLAEGTFSGFDRIQIDQSFDLLKTTIEKYENRVSDDETACNQPGQNIAPINRRVSGDVRSTPGEERLATDGPAAVNEGPVMKPFGIFLDKVEATDTIGPDAPPSDGSENGATAKKNSGANERAKPTTAPHALSSDGGENVATAKGGLGANESAKLPSARGATKMSENRASDKYENGRVRDADSKKENLLLSLPDTETEEVVDVNLWEKNEMVKKKRKSLFKSVKERNRKSSLFDASASPLLSAFAVGEESVSCRANGTDDGASENAVAGRKTATEFENFAPPLKLAIANRNAVVGVIGNVAEDGIFSAEVVADTQVRADLTETLPERFSEDAKSMAKNCELLLRGAEVRLTRIGERSCLESSEKDLLSGKPCPKISQVAEQVPVVTVIDDTVQVISDATKNEIFSSDFVADSQICKNMTKTHPEGAKSTSKNREPPLRSVEVRLMRIGDKIGDRSCQETGEKDLLPKKLQSEISPAAEQLPVVTVIENTANSGSVLLENSGFVASEKEEELFVVSVDAVQEDHVSNQPVYNHDNSTTRNIPVQLPQNIDCNDDYKSQNIPASYSSIEIVEKSIKESHDSSENQYVLDSAEMVEDDGFEKANKQEIKLKCAKLRKAINDQNQRLLVNMKKNFYVASPNSLMIEKCKSPGNDAGQMIHEVNDIPLFEDPEDCVTKCEPQLVSNSLNVSQKIDSEENR